MSIRITTGSADVTRGIGEAVARVATGPLAILLVGDYGTGKTTFVQGIARGLDIEGPVRSPSYNIMKRYTGRMVLVHADLYRTTSAPEIEELGLVEIMGTDGILAVEWPGRYLPPAKEMPSLSVHFNYPSAVPSTLQRESSDIRNLEISWSADCPPRILEVLRALASR